MLRSARQAQGLHIAALAASIKVPQAKLEALEAERYQDLPDATFARALAQTVCRALKIDPGPVLAGLPAGHTDRLERVDGGLNAPFRERPGHADPMDWRWIKRPSFWVVALLLGAAAAVSFLPMTWFQSMTKVVAAIGGRSESADPARGNAMPAELPASALAGAIVEHADMRTATVTTAAGDAASASVTGHAPPAAVVVAASVPTVAPAALASATRIRAVQASWVQVTDSRGQVLLSRVLAAGEEIGFDNEPPLKLRIGNASGTEVLRNGQPVDLAPSTRDNIANLEIR
ncbi:RodZ domain-containing protein [Ideonella sp. A 288]|uniref:RodZ domain-containing protein n=1 Tax=Ideonella sp. A 288 TaxID=1962181 RepID=UPI001F2B86AA|nr:RodZ domain-containing protein [Ideonella sp. A 288]